MIALRETAPAAALHRQKEIKADHEPGSPVLGAFHQSLQTRWAVYTLYLCVDDPDLNEKIRTKQELRTVESIVKGQKIEHCSSHCTFVVMTLT